MLTFLVLVIKEITFCAIFVETKSRAAESIFTFKILDSNVGVLLETQYLSTYLKSELSEHKSLKHTF